MLVEPMNLALPDGLSVYVERHVFHPDHDIVMVGSGLRQTCASVRATVRCLRARYNVICYDPPRARDSCLQHVVLLSQYGNAPILLRLIERFEPNFLYSPSWGGFAALQSLSRGALPHSSRDDWLGLAVREHGTHGILGAHARDHSRRSAFARRGLGPAVRWYFRFHLTQRDIEELPLERGVVVCHEAIRRWCNKFDAGFKADWRKLGGTWHLDEMVVRYVRYLLWRVVDEHGAELDVLLQKRRDKAAAKRIFQRVLRTCPAPLKIVTDHQRSYPAAKVDIPELAHVRHVFVKAATPVNNRAENSHQPTRERRMRGFRLLSLTPAFLSRFGPIRQHFALRRGVVA